MADEKAASGVDVLFNDGVASIELTRPEAGNAINLRTARDLLDAALMCSGPDVRAVVLAGAGRNFCVGGDLKAIVDSGEDVASFLNELTTVLHAAIAQFVRMDAPVIVAVNGTAAGAGLGLVLMADLAIAGTSARFAPAYTGVGLTPDAGTSFRLPRAVGHKRAMELLLTNRVLGADEALAWGLVNQVVPDADVRASAQSLAMRLAAGARGAFGGVKRLLAEAEPGLDSQLVREGRSIAQAASSNEGREGVRAFMEKRTASFFERT